MKIYRRSIDQRVRVHSPHISYLIEEDEQLLHRLSDDLWLTIVSDDQSGRKCIEGYFGDIIVLARQLAVQRPTDGFDVNSIAQSLDSAVIEHSFGEYTIEEVEDL